MVGQDQELSAWVGRSENARDVASRSAVVGLEALFDRPLSLDAADGAMLFPVGYWLQFAPVKPMSELGNDGHPKLGDFMPPLDLPRRMWAGSKIAFHSPIVVGQRIERVTTIESITPKTGSSGPLCFVVLRHDITAEGVLAAVEHQTIVYREAVEIDSSARSSRQPPRGDSPQPEGWDWVRTQRFDEKMLFCFSALTSNVHRIHYDLQYATGVEGYPGLVVHGPLSAAYLLDSFLAHHSGSTIRSFEFSVRSPIFVNEQVHFVGRADGNGAEELQVIAPGGGVAVVARIDYRSNDPVRGGVG